jgi:hypothetical protein
MRHLKLYEDWSGLNESADDAPDLARFNGSFRKAIMRLKSGDVEGFADIYLNSVDPYLHGSWATANKDILETYEGAIEEARQSLTPEQRIATIRLIKPELMAALEKQPQLMQEFGFYD